MTPGLSTHAFFDQRLHPGLLDALAAGGAQTGAGDITIEVFAARHHFDYTDPRQVREVASWFRSNPVRAVLHQPIYLTDGSRTFAGADPSQWSRHVAPNLNLISERKNARIAAMDEIKRAFESAEQIPFTAAVLHLGLRDTPWDDYAIEHSLTAIEHLKAFAGPLAMKILLENLQNDVATPQHLLYILKTGHFDNVGICLDLGHLHLTADEAETNSGSNSSGAPFVTASSSRVGLNEAEPSTPLAQAISILGPRIALVHLHDNHGPFGKISSPTELHDEHLWPGEGDPHTGMIDWPATITALEQLPPATPAILEPAPTRDMPADQVTRKALDFFSRQSRILEELRPV